MTRRFLAVVALVLLCFLPGCATMATLVTPGGVGIAGPRVFSGTWLHIDAMVNRPSKYWTPKIGRIAFWALIDLPISFVADIVVLPYTIPAQLAWGDFKEEEEETPATRKTEK